MDFFPLFCIITFFFADGALYFRWFINFLKQQKKELFYSIVVVVVVICGHQREGRHDRQNGKKNLM